MARHRRRKPSSSTGFFDGLYVVIELLVQLISLPFRILGKMLEAIGDIFY